MPFVRCANCNARRSLNMRPSDYASPGRVPACRTCGYRHYWQDNFRAKRRKREVTCTCATGYYGFPHRRGSKWCGHAPWTAEQAEAAFGAGPVPQLTGRYQ